MAEHKTHRRLRIIGGAFAGKRLLSGRGETTRPMMEKAWPLAANHCNPTSHTLTSMLITVLQYCKTVSEASASLSLLQQGDPEAGFF